MRYSIKLIISVLTLIICINPAFSINNYDEGLKAYNHNQFSIAKTFFLNEIKINPNNVNARYMLSQIYIKEKNYKEAKKEYKYIVNNAPNSQAAAYSKQGLTMLEKYNSNSSTPSNSTPIQTVSITTKTAKPKPAATTATETTKSVTKPSTQTQTQTTKPSGDFGIVKQDTITTKNPANQNLTYYYYVPETLMNKSGYPIVFFIPGLNGDGRQLLQERAQVSAKQHGYAIASITFKFDENDFKNEASYQYPKAWAGQAFKNILYNLKAKNVKYKDVYISGFSAGAQFASRFAMENPNFLKGCALLGSGAHVVPTAPQNTKFFVAIGENDDDVRKKNYEDFLKGAKRVGLNVKSKIYPNMGHSTNGRTEQDVIDFVVQTMNK